MKIICAFLMKLKILEDIKVNYANYVIIEISSIYDIMYLPTKYNIFTRGAKDC